MQAIDAGRREYRIPGWLRGLYVLAGLFSSGIGIYIAYLLAQQTKYSALACLGILPLALGIYLLALALRSRLVFDGTRIELYGAFKRQSADFGEVAGFRTLISRNGTYWKLLLKQGRGSITIQPWLGCDELRAWFQQLTDLDEQDRKGMVSKIEQDQELGATPEDRLNALQRTRRWNIALAAMAAIAGAGIFFGAPLWRLTAAAVLALAPTVALYWLNRQPLLFSLGGATRDPRNELSLALLVPAIALPIGAIQANYVSLRALLPAMAVVTLAFFAAFYTLVRSEPRTPRFHVLVVACALFYGSGLILVGDTLLDRGPAATYQVQVVGKHTSGGDWTSYYLDLSPWGPYKGESGLSVSHKTYDSAQPGETVCVELHPGFLHAAWYERSACTAQGVSPATP